MGYRIQNRRDTAARWAEMNPILLEGEIGLVTDNANQYKVGDGIHAWNDLPLRGFTGTISQELGEDENAVVSQKVVTEKLVEADGKLAKLGQEVEEITSDILVGENTTLWINKDGVLNTTLPDHYGSKRYSVLGVKEKVEILTPLIGNESVSIYTLLDENGNTIVYGDTTNISNQAYLDLSKYPSAKELYVSYSVEDKNTIVKIKYNLKKEVVELKDKVSEQGIDIKKMYYDAKSTSIELTEGIVFQKGNYYTLYNVGQSFRNKTSSEIVFNSITYHIKAATQSDVLLVFKASSSLWIENEYLTNVKYSNTSYFTKLYEGIVSNDDKEAHTIMIESVTLQPNESIFVVVFSKEKTSVLLTNTYEKGNKEFGYPCVFSLEESSVDEATCYYGYQEYSCYPLELSLSSPYVLKSELQEGRGIVLIKNTDSEITILHKMIEAYKKGNCDVIWEFGVYSFSEIYPYMQNTLGWGWDEGKGLPIGKGCRYFFNGSTLISNHIDGYTSTRNILDSVPNNATSFELNDGFLINYGGTYCVHDEGNAKEEAYIHLYKNMRMKYDAEGVGTGGCIGAGTGFNAMIKIEDCYFWTNKENGYPIGIHGVVNNTNNKSVRLTLFCSNSYFNQASISFNIFDRERDDVFVQFCNNRTTLDFDGKSGLKTICSWNNNQYPHN